MATITVTKEQMIIDINNHFTGMVESITCNGEYQLKSGSYRFLKEFKKSNGIVQDIYVPYTCLIEGYHNYGVAKLPSHLEKKITNDELLTRVWCNLQGIK